MAKKTDIVLREGIFIPIQNVPSVSDALDAYTTHMFEESACRNCTFKRDRPSAACDECELGGYKGSFCTAVTAMKAGDKYLKVPMGDKRNVEDKVGIDFDDFNFVDKRNKKKFKNKGIKFTGDLRDYQVPVQKSWIKHGFGLTKSAPRTGKTVMGIANGIRLGRRVLILADQKDFLDGFYETVENLTNMLEIEEIKNKKIFGFLKKKEDYFNYDIALLTYQSLISDVNGAERIRWINKNFGTVIVDEVHRANADCFARVISKLRMKHKFGLTATPKRKDGREFLVKQLIGPITASTTVKALTPTVYCHKLPEVKLTGNMSGPGGFSRSINQLSSNKARNAHLIKCILYDLKLGHSICVPCMRKSQVDLLVKEVNKQFGKEIAAAFVGGTKDKLKRKQVVNDARSGKIKVVVGIRSLLQLGINIPAWSCLYYQMPMSNESNWDQESSRVCTPDDTKRDPIVRMFIDEKVGLSLGCWRNTLNFSQQFGHKIANSAHKIIAELGSRSNRGNRAEDVPYDVDHSADNTISYGAHRKKSKQSVNNSYDSAGGRQM